MKTTIATPTGRRRFWTTLAPAFWTAGTVSMLMIGTGCANRTSMTPADQDLAGPVPDQATTQRGFDQSVALYADGGALAGTPTFRYQPKRYMDSSVYYVSDFGIFFANLVTSPFTAFAERGERKYEGVVFVPSYTMNPILPVAATDDATTDPKANPPVNAEMVEPAPTDAPATDTPANEVAPTETMPADQVTPTEPPAATDGQVSPTEEVAPSEGATSAPTEEPMN
jgi:hypothetical protein